MITTFFGRCSVLFIVTMCIAVALQSQDDSLNYQNSYRTSNEKQAVYDKNEQLQRSKRLFLKKQQSKPGFFRLVGRLIFEQVNETTSAYRQIVKIIRDSFADSNGVTTTTTENPDPNATTTMAPYRLTREELFGIVRRNFRGLVRLFKIELQDALNQSSYSIKEYKQEFANEIGRIVG